MKLLKKNGYIDNSEINLFTNKAVALINEQKCTAQDLATIFSMNEADNTNITDVFAKVDSLHNAKNTPEALGKDAEEIKQAEKRKMIKEINAKIAENNKKLKLYEKRLAQKEISCDDYKDNTIPSASEQKILNWFGGVGLGIATVSALTLFAINKYKKISLSKPEGQEKIRNEYKEAYLKVTQENEQLKVQLAVLQNK